MGETPPMDYRERQHRACKAATEIGREISDQFMTELHDRLGDDADLISVWFSWNLHEPPKSETYKVSPGLLGRIIGRKPHA